MTDDFDSLKDELGDIRNEHPRLMKAFETGEFDLPKDDLPKDELKELTEKITDITLPYTLKYIEKKNDGKVWSIDNQLLHAQSELSEVYSAMRDREGIERILHEVIDVIYKLINID